MWNAKQDVAIFTEFLCNGFFSFWFKIAYYSPEYHYSNTYSIQIGKGKLKLYNLETIYFEYYGN